MDSSLTGSKAANLSVLIHNRFPVPKGYAVTTEAFKDFCIFNGISIRDDVSAQELAEAITNGIFSPDLANDIGRSLNGLNGTSFAIRSSAIGEDGFTDSMGEQLQTFLCVPKEQAQEKIKACWSSF